MNLDQIHSAVTNRRFSEHHRSDFRQFRAFRAFTSPRGYKVMPRHHRSVANINTSNSVCISSVSTAKASKYQRVSVSLIHMPATRTASTGILGTNQFESNSFGCGFVLHKELSHRIRPTMDTTSHFLTFGNTGFTDVSQIFHDDSLSALLFRPRHKPLRGTVQKMFGYGCFVPAQTLQESARGTSANRLDLGFGFSDATTTGIEFPAMESESFTVLGIGSSENSLDATIDSNNTTIGLWFGDVDFVAQQQIPNRTNPFKFGVLPSFHWWNSIVSHGNGFTPEAKPFRFGKGEVSLPNHRYNFSLKDSLSPAILGFLGLKRSGNMAKSSASQLRWQVKLFAKFCVMFFVKINRIDIFGFKNNLGDFITSIEEVFAELIKNLRFSDFNFDCSSAFQDILLYNISLENPSFCVKDFERTMAAIPPLPQGRLRRPSLGATDRGFLTAEHL